MQPHIEVAEDGDALARAVAEWFVNRVNADPRPMRIALSGGSTPRTLYTLLASAAFKDRMPWSRLSFFFGDERLVPPDHPDSNYRMVRETLLRDRPVADDRVYPIPTDGSAEEAARKYEETLRRVSANDAQDGNRPLFDIIFLGLGGDGHTASLIPGQPVLNERRRWVAPVTSGRAEARVTLTYPAIHSSRAIAFLVTGAEKAAAVKGVMAGDANLPATSITSEGEIFWYLDRAAAGQLTTRPS
ncbi:MAG TPA: 6-phosphogluconolactonase [Rhizomicrobium sp.]|jgi:6-phosphogluconolactonase